MDEKLVEAVAKALRVERYGSEVGWRHLKFAARAIIPLVQQAERADVVALINRKIGSIVQADNVRNVLLALRHQLERGEHKQESQP